MGQGLLFLIFFPSLQVLEPPSAPYMQASCVAAQVFFFSGPTINREPFSNH